MVASTQSVTETLIVVPKEKISLDDAANESSRVFVQLTNTLKSQPGYTRQFWGYQVENPQLFVWSIDWESLESHTIFTKSEDYNSFKIGFDQVFDLKAVEPVILYTRFTVNEAFPAFQAAVTEVAFYTLPGGTTDEIKSSVANGSSTVIEQVQSIGKAEGASLGWSEFCHHLYILHSISRSDTS
ncbi:hypothetical protein PVAG01_09532 [Phlyctema vagabunda]|uniref:ABM domain-containing protein n=1 Tax=Phlyctema vagabunda TaxID=108571 RepID=A0ABR4P7N8_9HELO